MKRTTFSWGTLLLLALVALSVQGCLGFGGGPSGKQVGTGTNGQQVTVKQDAFKGKFYLTIGHNLYAISGDGNSQELVNTGNVYDPAVSPDGKSIAFIEKSKQYSNLCLIAATGGQVQVLRNGNQGGFYYNGPFVHNHYYWYAQPAWSPDGSHLLFLSDLEKEDWYQQTGIDAPLLDMQVFSISINTPSATPQDVAYASFGDGGNRDESYRPGHPDEIVYTHYAYDAATQTQQVIQLFLENPDAISEHPHRYYPGAPGGGFDPGIAITDGKAQDLQPAFSPDGSAIAYVQRDNNQMSLNVMPVPPDSITQTPNDPNTEKLAVQTYQTQSSHLLSALYVQQPVWSPDGKQIAYVTYMNGSFDLWITNVRYNAKTGVYTTQGSPIQVTTGGVDGEVRPVWTS